MGCSQPTPNCLFLPEGIVSPHHTHFPQSAPICFSCVPVCAAPRPPLCSPAPLPYPAANRDNTWEPKVSTCEQKIPLDPKNTMDSILFFYSPESGCLDERVSCVLCQCPPMRLCPVGKCLSPSRVQLEHVCRPNLASSCCPAEEKQQPVSCKKKNSLFTFLVYKKKGERKHVYWTKQVKCSLYSWGVMQSERVKSSWWSYWSYFSFPFCFLWVSINYPVTQIWEL